ncbi:hypothetical protein HNP00_004358 [Arthrobacter sp. AZCC_0090]|nr:hypothetical protein [Arthrobacter sp. AZCC_0090]
MRLLVDRLAEPGNSRSGRPAMTGIFNMQDWDRMIPSTTYILSLWEH